ncbi:MAG: bifunctional riboflavin kinase/FAD synthetase [Candidatus Marinimicrobia bacterium]|jgi:riboflavin kinase/FMN adenylyltransferase|nr:bifunctional riboflavin kinase/FAD synthetase [Candidatus Neomarinimicrobiota bacterium]HJM46955.1 bifunctional riboflavin kinase/FAD synthetase [Candidatus Neomarinimicrobiota bacterium]|tara:strand:+ start:4748 stop:5686 length:939 start_codon:yes stop_codon:yes gene_type:complete
MERYFSVDQISAYHKSVLTIGSFDGLHRGHQEIVNRTINVAKGKQVPSIVVTFNPHPRHILNIEETKVPIIMSLDNKLNMLENLGVDGTLIIPFTSEFSKLSASEFLESIIEKQFHPEELVIGYDHHFGYNRTGSPEYLKEYIDKSDINLTLVEAVSDEGSIISSTRVREKIKDGYIRRANFELGWIYGFDARVVSGSGRGHTLSYPTANFIPLASDQLLPKTGVYLTRGRVVGKQLFGMCNLGYRPTFDEGKYVMEVHFFDFHDVDLYSQNIRIEFLERIRDEIKFKTKGALISQLGLDNKYCLGLLDKYI